VLTLTGTEQSSFIDFELDVRHETSQWLCTTCKPQAHSSLNQMPDNNHHSQDSFSSTLPPSYVSHPGNAPSSPVSNTGGDHERVSNWRSGISSAPSGTLADDTESLLADTDVLTPSKSRGASPPDWRYGTFLLVS
jgi:hypothetical protein